MGSVSSHEPLKSMEESGGDSVCLTPCKRVLYVDPRSPSVGIDRTPIVVEKTPPTDIFDPRSPTPGIARTPIASQTGQGQFIKAANPPPLNLLEDKFDGMSMDEENEEISTDSSNLLGNQQLSITGEVASTESSHLIPSSQDLIDTPVIGNKAKAGGRLLPKPLLARRENNSSSKSSDLRSPLRARNQQTDSPRNILQRKQIYSLDNKMSYKTVHSRENTPPSQDKENVKM